MTDSAMTASTVTPTTVLFDLDGVIRHFDPAQRSDIEQRAGLEPGTLEAAAFTEDLLAQLVTGKISRATWTRKVGEAVSNPDAAAAWLAQKGTVDREMIEFIDELRVAGVTVAILTNGTDTIPAELDKLGVTAHVDAIFNTAEIGFAKPDRRAFEHACAALGVDGPEVFFTDDSASKLLGAIELGMTVHHFKGIAPLRAAITAAGIYPR